MGQAFTPEQMSLFPLHKVTKSNVLIESKYYLSANENKLIALVVSAIQPEDTEFYKYEFYVKDIIKLLGLKSKGSYSTIEGTVQSLMEKVLTIRDIKTGRWKKYHWFSTAEYIPQKGILIFEIHKDMKPFFLQLQDKFTTYKLGNILDLKSGYSIRLYELLKQYQSLKERTISIAELREYLGVEPNEHKLYSHFKRHCILKPQEELKAKTDISFEFNEIKKGRAVDKIQFLIFSNEARADVIKRIFNTNDLYPSTAQVATMAQIFAEMTDNEIFNIAVKLKKAEKEGHVKSGIAVLMANPEQVIKSIREDTFYNTITMKKTKTKKTSYESEYEIYVSSDEIEELKMRA